MKKFIVSSVVLVTFIFYSILDRVMGLAKTSAPITPGPPTSPPPAQSGTAAKSYKDGEYTGAVTDAFYGNVQVKAVVKNGKIADVQFLSYPNDRRNSIEINSQAMPLLTQEAVQSQNANVDIVTGATATSQAFVQSLQSALDQAR